MQIEIGPFTYEIEEVERLLSDDNTRLWGQVDYDEGVIRLDKDMTQDRRHVTLWHEVLHAISEQNSLELPEQIVSVLSVHITDAIRRNPALTKIEVKA